MTLRLQQRALEFGMILKDASAYNIQLHNGRMKLIDTLSFEIYQDGQPWEAYRQFCQHFLAPLSLMAYTDVRLNQLLRIYIDGIPLDLAVKLLPFRARFNFGLMEHIYLHAVAQSWSSNKPMDKQISNGRVTKNTLFGMIDSLEATIRKLEWKPVGTEWGIITMQLTIPKMLLKKRRESCQISFQNANLNEFGIWVGILEYFLD